ncbi:hypothetical protein C7M84_004577 [Penaeus vannamei]|uniref:Uncharacterized protein n=1 Tax=Penaeus vannamei TaxID=6689 RepID=A0A3R7M9Q3_PENVA|nr:hypothetical protein C7M84_004577 [Penaeus vannamei]
MRRVTRKFQSLNASLTIFLRRTQDDYEKDNLLNYNTSYLFRSTGHPQPSSHGEALDALIILLNQKASKRQAVSSVPVESLPCPFCPKCYPGQPCPPGCPPTLVLHVTLEYVSYWVSSHSMSPCYPGTSCPRGCPVTPCPNAILDPRVPMPTDILSFLLPGGEMSSGLSSYSLSAMLSWHSVSSRLSIEQLSYLLPRIPCPPGCPTTPCPLCYQECPVLPDVLSSLVPSAIQDRHAPQSVHPLPAHRVILERNAQEAAQALRALIVFVASPVPWLSPGPCPPCYPGTACPADCPVTPVLPATQGTCVLLDALRHRVQSAMETQNALQDVQFTPALIAILVAPVPLVVLPLPVQLLCRRPCPPGCPRRPCPDCYPGSHVPPGCPLTPCPTCYPGDKCPGQCPVIPCPDCYPGQSCPEKCPATPCPDCYPGDVCPLGMSLYTVSFLLPRTELPTWMPPNALSFLLPKYPLPCRLSHHPMSRMLPRREMPSWLSTNTLPNLLSGDLAHWDVQSPSALHVTLGRIAQ